MNGCETLRNEVEVNLANLRMRDLQPKDAQGNQQTRNSPSATIAPHNCCLVVDLRSVRHDQSGGSGTIRGFL
jgi:hypothetical protein